MISLIEKIRSWCAGRPANNSRLVVVRIYCDGKLVMRQTRFAIADTRCALMAVANAITSDAYGAERRIAKMNGPSHI